MVFPGLLPKILCGCRFWQPHFELLHWHMPFRVLVSGTSGPIGTALIPSLKSRGNQIARLVRPGSSSPAGSDEERIPWNPMHPISPELVSGFQAVIHLAGESILGRWTAGKKARIRDSRVQGTRNLAEALAQTREKPQVFLCSSAIGYYGNRGDEVLKEDSSPGEGFLPQVCEEWEQAARPASDAGIRTVQMRTGVVLSAQGGALGLMLLPFKLGLGGRIGSGKQWMSWIDIQDMIGAIHHILKADLLQGAVNLVAPRPVTNEEFTKTLASALSRPAVLPVPAFALRALFGEMADEALLASERVEPTKLIMSGYPFRFRELQSSLGHLLKR